MTDQGDFKTHKELFEYLMNGGMIRGITWISRYLFLDENGNIINNKGHQSSINHPANHYIKYKSIKYVNVVEYCVEYKNGGAEIKTLDGIQARRLGCNNRVKKITPVSEKQSIGVKE